MRSRSLERGREEGKGEGELYACCIRMHRKSPEKVLVNKFIAHHLLHLPPRCDYCCWKRAVVTRTAIVVYRVSWRLGQEIKKNHPRRKEVLVFINPPPSNPASSDLSHPASCFRPGAAHPDSSPTFEGYL